MGMEHCGWSHRPLPRALLRQPQPLLGAKGLQRAMGTWFPQLASFDQGEGLGGDHSRDQWVGWAQWLGQVSSRINGSLVHRAAFACQAAWIHKVTHSSKKSLLDGEPGTIWVLSGCSRLDSPQAEPEIRCG